MKRDRFLFVSVLWIVFLAMHCNTAFALDEDTVIDESDIVVQEAEYAQPDGGAFPDSLAEYQTEPADVTVTENPPVDDQALFQAESSNDGGEIIFTSQPEFLPDEDIQEMKQKIALLETEVLKIPQLETEITALKNNLENSQKSALDDKADISSDNLFYVQLACISLSVLAMILSIVALAKSRRHYNYQVTHSQPDAGMPEYGKIGFGQLHSNRADEIDKKISLWRAKGFNDEIIKKELHRFGYQTAEIDFSMRKL